MSEDGHRPSVTDKHFGLRPYEDARSIVRLFQCSQCSYPIREPLTLPCGNSICRPCLPPLYARGNITYPQNADRIQGFTCPFSNCATEHSVADCSLDVTINKIVEIVKSHMSGLATRSVGSPLQLDEQLHLQKLMDSSIDVMPRSRVLGGGRIVSGYTFAAIGELNFHSEISYTPLDQEQDDAVRSIDTSVAATIKDVVRNELECHVCYNLMLDPLTTPCGHTFCRKCVARVLDHSTLCPACRRPMLMRPGVVSEPTNKRISWFSEGLLAEELATRMTQAQQEDALDEEWMPLFPCTLGFPQMPTFLHIFEPRYRLMIRRSIENGSRKFGMLMYNAHREPQGPLGRSTFMLYGTVLHISRLEMLLDGRSLLETQGVYRFKVLEAKMLDGYYVGRIQRLDDMPLPEEEAAEALDTSGPEPDPEDAEATLNHMSTQALLQKSLDFIGQARSRSERWLHERVLAAYGQPPTDPALFPYWFASVLPISDDEKYLLMPITSVRERLKITVRWIRIFEERRCAQLAALRRLAQERFAMNAGNNDSSSTDPEDSDRDDEPPSTQTSASSTAPPVDTSQSSSENEQRSGNQSQN